MSKRRVRKPKPIPARNKKAQLRRRHRRHKMIALVCLLLSLIGTGAAFAQWHGYGTVVLAQNANNLAPNKPAKEYIYAGGRLLATEEPTPTPIVTPTATPTPPPAPVNDASFISQTVPTTMTAGQSYQASITMQNTGTTTWTSNALYRLGSQNPQDNGTWVTAARINLPASKAPGEQAVFNFTVTAPATAGTYNFQWKMVQDGVEWFGAYTLNVSITVVAQPSGGALSGTVASMGTTTANLTQEGTADWAHWGQFNAASFDHKTGVGSQISNYSVIGTGTVNAYGNHGYAFAWTNGTPTPSATTTTGVYVTGAGNGYRITVPADTATRTLKLHVGAYYAQGRLEATLSDNSSPAYVDTSLNANAGVSNGAYTLSYHAASANQTLTITFTMQSDYGGNVAMQAATLTGTGNTTLTAPSNLVATATSATQVALSWTASTNGTVDHYRVERSTSLGAPFIPVQASPTGTSFTDTTATSGVAYLYRVCAVDASSNLSQYSNTDLATTIIFTDDPLTSGVTVIKAQHLTELRQAVNAVRATAGLGAATWTDASAQGVAIKAVHLQELRTNVDQALSTLGFATQPYTDPNLIGIGVKKTHIEELRQRVK